MEIAFDTRQLRTICETEAEARRQLGPRVAESLQRRLADLRAATTIDDLVVGTPHELSGSEAARMAVNLSDGLRMVFRANHPTNPTTEDGRLDWPRVGRVRILRIENYDDN